MKSRNAVWLLCFAATAVAQVTVPPPPPPMQLTAAESAVLVPLVNAWKGENAVIATEGFPYSRSFEPPLRLELLRRGVGDDVAEELLRTLAKRNATPVSIVSPALAGVTRGSMMDLFRRSIARDPTLAKLGPLRMIAVPAVTRDAAIVLMSSGRNPSLTYLTKSGDSWRVAWTKEFSKRDFTFVADPDAIPHRAVLTADDIGVIDAFIEATHAQSLFNRTTVEIAPPAHDAYADLRAANRQRSPVQLFVGGVKLRHAVTMIDAVDPRNRSAIGVSLPGYSADHTRALMAYSTTIGAVSSGEAIFEKRGGNWVYVRDVGEAYWQHPPNAADLPLRAGGPVLAPRVLKRVEPQFPAGTQKRLHFVEVTVGTDGRVTQVTPLTDAPGPVADAINAAVRQWEFAPGTLNGKAVKVIHNVTISVP